MSEETESVKFDKIARKIKDLPASFQALGLALSSTGTSTANVADNAEVSFIMTLSNDFGLRLFGMPAVTLYESSVSADNAIPRGANISDGDYIYAVHIDWGLTDNNNIKIVAWVRNQTGSAQDILFRGNVRFITETADV